MIIISKSGYLKYKKFKFRCALGKAGIGKKKIEGDNITPKGKYKIIKVFYRADRIEKLKTNYKLIKINKNIGWCDDPKSENYNKVIYLPSKFGHEKLYRKDKIYDLILALDYNYKPVIRNKGSAIFIHIANQNYKSTRGCIALKKSDLILILEKIKKSTIVKIQ
jgi:L,D-peptidoglycan transpeptidase YkuD (ErfK/YbiS/YcfS/YnhG family)